VESESEWEDKEEEDNVEVEQSSENVKIDSSLLGNKIPVTLHNEENNTFNEVDKGQTDNEIRKSQIGMEDVARCAIVSEEELDKKVNELLKEEISNNVITHEINEAADKQINYGVAKEGVKDNFEKESSIAVDSASKENKVCEEFSKEACFIYVSGFRGKISKKSLQKAFAKFGTVTRMKQIGKTCMVQYENPETVADIINSDPPLMFNGKVLNIRRTLQGKNLSKRKMDSKEESMMKMEYLDTEQRRQNGVVEEVRKSEKEISEKVELGRGGSDEDNAVESSLKLSQMRRKTLEAWASRKLQKAKDRKEAKRAVELDETKETESQEKPKERREKPTMIQSSMLNGSNNDESGESQQFE